MKNTNKILLLLGISFLFVQCLKKDEVRLSAEEIAVLKIKEAKEFFETQFDPDDENLKTNFGSESGNSKRHTLEKSLDWQRAYTKEFEDGRTGVYVPVLYADDNYYIKAHWASLSLSGLTYALIYEKEQGKKSVEIVTTFPDSKYLSSEEKPKLFSGTVYVEDWNGKFIKSLRHINGKIFLLEAKLQEKRSLLMDDCTEIIDWYTCSSSDGGSTWDCHLSYTEVIFVPCDGGGGGDVASSSSYVYTPADDGGGTPADETDVAEECNCDICPVCGGCLSTSFKYVPADDDTTDPIENTLDCPPCSCSDTEDPPACPGDPVYNPEIAPSGASGKGGGTFGCTRVNPAEICGGVKGKQNHNGLDIKATLNSNLFSMYSGTISNVRNTFSSGEYKPGSYGNFVVLTTVINGSTYHIKYNHLNSVSVLEGQPVNTGDIIGLTGNTGNANNPKSKVKIIPHVHIQVYNSDWSQSLDPEDFLQTKFDSDYEPISNNCL